LAIQVNRALACGIVVDLKMYFWTPRMQIGVRLRKRVKIFLHRIARLNDIFFARPVWTESNPWLGYCGQAHERGRSSGSLVVCSLDVHSRSASRRCRSRRRSSRSSMLHTLTWRSASSRPLSIE